MPDQEDMAKSMATGLLHGRCLSTNFVWQSMSFAFEIKRPWREACPTESLRLAPSPRLRDAAGAGRSQKK
jgi:hypothetical protein